MKARWITNKKGINRLIREINNETTIKKSKSLLDKIQKETSNKKSTK